MELNMKDRWTAIPLAFFLGGIGVHRFYLQQYVYGILYLLFCFTFVPLIVAFIDGIIWLIQDDNKFNEKYNNSKSTK